MEVFAASTGANGRKLKFENACDPIWSLFDTDGNYHKSVAQRITCTPGVVVYAEQEIRQMTAIILFHLTNCEAVKTIRLPRPIPPQGKASALLHRAADGPP